jgi:hypothetical protein
VKGGNDGGALVTQHGREVMGGTECVAWLLGGGEKQKGAKGGDGDGMEGLL